ncbi:MAG: hypothetical protein LLG14_19635 [Nocardiaceae bacterium]|nr:hypothetical protein [Nocardiaceae bacterium]
MTFDYLGAMTGHNWERALSRAGDYVTPADLDRHTRSSLTDADYELLDDGTREDVNDRYAGEPEVIVPAGSWLTGTALRWSEYANVRRGGEWVRETFTRASFDKGFPNRTPVKLGHLGRTVGAVELWFDNNGGLEFDMRLTEAVQVRRGTPVSIGFVHSEERDLVIEARGGRPFVVPQNAEIDHLALLVGKRDGAYPSARVTGIEIERRDRNLGEIEIRPAGPILGIR